MTGKSDAILHLQIRDDAAEHRLNLVRILFPICDHVAAIPIARNSIIIVPLSTHRGSPEAYGLCLLQDYVQFVDFDVFHENVSFTILYHCDTVPGCDTPAPAVY
jgi:hypothetical protein